eukprot:16034216-Heterocapsa_arctica.AAC.1
MLFTIIFAGYRRVGGSQVFAVTVSGGTPTSLVLMMLSSVSGGAGTLCSALRKWLAVLWCFRLPAPG